MLFNSYQFIFIFLPTAFSFYFILNKYRLITGAKLWLVACSLFFYSWWNIDYLPLILISIFVNYLVGTALDKGIIPGVSRQLILVLGVSFNLGLLGYFKYADFFIENFNVLTQRNIQLLHLTLPLAVSFFTFQQITYLIDNYQGEARESDFISYALFVSFFPQLIAGPIVNYREMMPQFLSVRNKIINYRNISVGLFIFFIGLFKKVIIADTFSLWATNGFDKLSVLSFTEAWITSLSYTTQIYFDFSGYTDMAIGAALLFNIVLPDNFNSPYKALNIQDFWRRWHMTLSRFLRNYLYIPLGGNHKGNTRTYINLMLTFLLGGLWHGAAWTFVFWGLLHGLAMVAHRIWKDLGYKMHWLIGWFLTFNFVNITWVFFRAEKWEDALKLLKGMFGLSGFVMPEFFSTLTSEHIIALVLFAIFSLISLGRNSIQMKNDFQPNRVSLASLLFFSISLLFIQRASEFLYFNF